ncbi:MAG TPA: dTDP-4-dehydrorhamnose reductase [bacterium]|mgnify:CR=1 FL=1|nr:dTDP-4-dehydrorhamnose reductase [bacterium]
MKILITGADGMLGKDIAIAFSNHDLILTDKEELDITNLEELNKKIIKLNPDVIINCAAFVDVEKAENEEEIVSKINTEAVLNLAKICKNNSCILAHISTEYVFDGENKSGYNEDSPTNPINIYGKSKADGERLLQKNLNNFYIIRSSWLYGKNPQKGKERGMNFVETMLKLATEKDELNLIIDQISKPTYTKDLSLAIKQLIEENYPFGIYHLTNEDAVTPHEFAQEIFKIKNIKNIKLNQIGSSDFHTKAKRPKNAILNNTKFPKLRSFKEALKDYLDS